MTRSPMTHPGTYASTRARYATLIATVALVGAGACKDTDIPFLTAPTSVAATPAGVGNAIIGLFGGSRVDIANVAGTVQTVAAGFARDGAIFSNSDATLLQFSLGVFAPPTFESGIWAQEYTNIRQAQQILATIPNVAPAYSTAQAAAITGVVRTLQAYNYMLIAEAHDTLGLAILPAGTLTSVAPAVCNKDGWEYIVALLDSANTNLGTAGAAPAPTPVPKGFAGVSVSSGPPSTVGSFASFNRALAAKANLELAYAIARSPGGAAPTDVTPGVPNSGALATALADLEGSAMWDTTLLAPNTPGGFTPDAHTVTHDFSATSGDIVNPIQANIGAEAQLNDFTADVDTANDLRFKAKFIINPNPVQLPSYNTVAYLTTFDAAIGHDTTYSYLYYMSPSPASSIPITRTEELTLVAAQIELGMGNYAQAIALANQVRTKVGGLPPATVAANYVAARNFLMKEQRISTTWESSADRTIAIRMYGMAAVSDTTWEHEDPSVTTGDPHVTVMPIPQSELNGRGGTFTTSCS
jgi:starch-binding outer membrane protein, SusD/RagB family